MRADRVVRSPSKICRACSTRSAFALDANLSVPCQNLHAQRIANLPQVLIAAPENRQLLGMALETDRDFWHAWPLAGSHGADSAHSAHGTLQASP